MSRSIGKDLLILMLILAFIVFIPILLDDIPSNVSSMVNVIQAIFGVIVLLLIVLLLKG